MANATLESLEGHILLGYLSNPTFIDDTSMQESFEDRFINIPFTEQYRLMAHMFSHMTDMAIQPWLMNLANRMVKTQAPNYNNSQFKNKSTMVEFFIKQYSYGEVEELRNTLWSLIK